MRVRLRDVAQAAGTSVAAASATLHGSAGDTIRVGEATRQRIRDIARELGYVANPIAKSLATGKTRSLGLILPYADAFLDQNPFCAQVMHGVMREVVHRHYNLTLYTAVEEIHQDVDARKFSGQVDGLVLVMPPDHGATQRRCEDLGIPLVSVLQRPLNGSWCVNADDYEGGWIAAKHLLDLGHTSIAHLGGEPEVPTSALRAQGFRDALIDGGVEPDPKMFVTAGFNAGAGYRVMYQLLSDLAGRSPSAVFAANDLCADGAIRAIRDADLRVPEDVSVIGYDDTWFAERVHPPLTTVHMPIAEMGETAAAMLIDRLEGLEPKDKQPVLPVSLTIRNSSGSPATLSPSGDGAVSHASLSSK